MPCQAVWHDSWNKLRLTLPCLHPTFAQQGTIAGRRDIAGGRLRSDRRTADNTSSGRCFTSLAYSADGSFLLAGGSSK